jgi:ribosome-binding factor A
MKKRSAMLGSEIRQAIGPVLRECPRECGIVNIVTVEVSDDFSYATVLISALLEPERALKFLEGRRGDLQKRIANVGVHRTPKLRFRIDRDTERASRIDALLEKASKKNADDSSGSMQDHPDRK